MSELKLYNTLGRREEIFVPLKAPKVGMYVCGVTVYDYCHIGHARSALFFDMFYRFLKHLGYEVTYVRNFTDVDDKIIARANKEGRSYKEVSEQFIEEFYHDMDSLGILRPDVEPKATEHIDQMIELVSGLVAGGYAYVVEGDVYYDVTKFEEYGKLSGRTLEEMKAGARIEVGDEKRNPWDFALWKASKPGEPAWDSPWGPGRPGWHIECSAMSMAYLGSTLDIHGGGLDLVFPHHENEIAQSEAYTGQQFSRFWVHNGFVSVNNEKMSKSLGNFLLIRDMVKNYHPEVLRFFLLGSHYRTPIDFSQESLEEAHEAMNRLYRTLEARAEVKEKPEKPSSEGENLKALLEEKSRDFDQALLNDLNSALAMAKVFEGAREVNRYLKLSGDSLSQKSAALESWDGIVSKCQKIFGILNEDPATWFTSGAELPMPVEEIEALIEKRNQARKAKNWAEADAIRDQLKEKGILLEDKPGGKTVWRIA